LNESRLQRIKERTREGGVAQMGVAPQVETQVQVQGALALKIDTEAVAERLKSDAVLALR